MKRWLVFLSAFASLYSDESSAILSHFHAIHSGIVGGHVNVITGDFVDQEIDIQMAGAEPLALSRNYTSSKAIQRSFCNEGWVWNYQLYLFSYEINKEKWVTFCGGSSGAVVSKDMKVKEGKGFLHRMNHFIGFTNAGSALLTGKTNAKNTRIFIPDPKEIKSKDLKGVPLEVSVEEGNGDKYTFQGPHTGVNDKNVKYYYPKLLSRPCGIKYKYHFLSGTKIDDIRHRFPFEKMEQILPSGLAGSSIWVDNFWEEGSYFKSPRMRFKSSDGQETTYYFHRHEAYVPYFLLTRVVRSRKPEIHYGYSLPGGQIDSRITAKRVGDLNLEVNYYNQEEGSGCPRIVNRVKALKVNHNQATLYRFDYTKENETLVIDGNGHQKLYVSNDKSRLVEIRHLSKGVPIVTEKFTYGPRKTHYEGNLIRKELKGKEEQSLYTLFYEYDEHNNVALEKCVGDFTGKGEPQTLFIHHENYGDILNNPKLTWEDNGRSTLKTYLPQSSLVEASYYREHDVIKKREFRSYDPETSILKEVIEDDGSSIDRNDLKNVTKRKIVSFSFDKEAPLGLPTRIESFIQDPKMGEKILVSSIERKYLKTGEIIEERNYGKNGVFKEAQYWNYDAHGNVLLHIDPAGREFIKKYDALDRLIYSQGPRKDVHYEYEYDLENRLIAEREVHFSGEVFTKRYRYDVMGNKIAYIDPFGNETNYVYDELDRLVQTIYPEIETGERPTVFIEYNELGFPIKTIDCFGNATKTLYTVRGKPYRIERPDGSIESFEYSMEGNLVKKIGCDGRVFLYTYDLQNRLVQEEELASSGKSLGVIVHEYDAYNRIKTIDRAELTTTYEYDAAGLLIREQCGKRYKNYTYDPFGRLIASSDGTAVKRFKYDLLDRVNEEIEENSNGKIQSLVRFMYDESGHKSHVYTYINCESVVFTEYNAKGLPIRIIDQEGLETHFSYNYQALDPMNHRVLETTVTDPSGNRLVTTLNTRGKAVKIRRFNPIGELLAMQENVYDLQGNLIKTVHHQILAGETKRRICHEMEYDAMGRLIALTQAVGEPEQKRERSIYNRFGQKVETIKNDGVSILMSYNELGLLERHSASDRSFEYVYTYNSNKQPVAIEDKLRNQRHSLFYNAYKELEKEVLQNGLTLKYEIDDFGRIEKVILPDESKIEYRFDGKRIKSIKRNQYIHTYEIYNLGGTPTTIKLANGKGLSSYLDSKGRYLSISSPYFTENDFVYDRRGNLNQHNLNGELKTYEYSDLNQLISDGSDKYSYDSLHNRLFKNQEFYSHNSLNQLLAKNDTVYKYDLNGNRIEKRTPCSTTTYKYDALDRLIEVNADGKTTTYSYDAFNRRMMKNDTSYLYQGQNEIGSMRNNSFLDLRVLGVGLGAEIGSAVLCEIEGVPYVPIHDHNGNVRQLLTMQGELAAAYSYTAFGETIASTVHPNLWRFSSKRFDEETGFINFGRRYYDPEIGRFLTPDPIGFEEGPNLYAYLHNAPLLSFDLYGLLDEDRSWWDKTCDRISSAWDSLCSAARGAWDFVSDGISRAGRAFRDGASSSGRAFCEGFRYAGRFGKWLAHNSIPHIPIVKDAIQIPFHLIEYGSFKNYTPTYRETHSQWYVCGEIKNPDVVNVEVNGIKTETDDFFERLQDASMALGGKEVYGCYVASHGLVADLFNCIFDFLGISTHASSVLAEGLSGLSQMVSSKGQVICNAFSRGCMVLQNAIDRAISRGSKAAVFYANYLAPPKLPANKDYTYRATISSRDSVTTYSRICNFFSPDSNVHIKNGQGIYMADHKFDNRVYSDGYKYDYIGYTLDLLKTMQ